VWSLIKSDDYDLLPDRLWEEVFKLDSQKARDIVYLRFEYGLKIQEIAKIKGCSIRYIHKVLERSLKKIKNNSKN
jgi:DNA-directed RNA polymerase specialized sigma24 family protein